SDVCSSDLSESHAKHMALSAPVSRRYDALFKLEICMRRREFFALVGGTTAAALLPLATLAQQASKSYRVGYLALLPGERVTLANVLLQRLQELGYGEGKNIVIEYRSAEG